MTNSKGSYMVVWQVAGRGLALLLSLLLLVACTVSIPPPTPPETPATVTPDPAAGAETAGNEDSVAGTSWQLVSLGSAGSETAVQGTSVLTLQFGDDGSVGGEGGCNSFGGIYVVDGNSISFSELVSTLMACVDEDLTTQEAVYLSALGSAERYEITGDQLTIWYEGGNNRLNFEAVDGLGPSSSETPASPLVPKPTPATPTPQA